MGSEAEATISEPTYATRVAEVLNCSSGGNVTKNDLIPKKKRKHGESLQHEPKCLQLRDGSELFHTDKYRFREGAVTSDFRIVV